MSNSLLPKLALSSAIVFLSSPALAASGHDHSGHDHGSDADSNSPFYGHLDVKVHADSIVNAGEADEEIDEIYTHSHMELGARFDNGFSVNSNIKLEGEPSGHAHGHGGGEETEEAGGDRIFEDHPLLVEQITVNYDTADYSLYAGKFNPIVSLDYHQFAGIYGYQTAESYNLREKIGVGAAYNYDAGEHGLHRLDVSTFFSDTTFLSESALYQRGNTSEEDGGLANTEDFSSYALSLGGGDFDHLEGLSYRIGYATQAEGIGNEDDETRYSVSAIYKHKINDETDAKFIVEHVNIDHLGGEAHHDRAYTTLSVGVDHGKWNIGGTYTAINNDAEEEDEGHNGDIVQASIGYQFTDHFGAHIGYQTADEDNETTDRVGALLTYNYSF